MPVTTPAPAPHQSLRLWPGVIAVILLWLVRFGTKLVVPGFDGFSRGMMGGMALALVIILWWVFFSRAPWLDRLGAILLMAGSMAALWAIKHESMGPLWLVGYAVPVLCLAFVASAAAGRRLSPVGRRLTMAACILVACAGWALARTDGIDGDHVATFAWRWSETAEQQLMAGGDGEPASRSADVTAPEASAWPGFRGPNRDGHAPGARIETDWAASPPVELWRRPVGPGWSSFAVQGDFFYTQEQRGEHEAIVCYRASTGESVWVHRDPIRFFESNAGAGPRGTPTLSNGRVYALGATGILNVLDARDGSVLWSRDLASDTDKTVPDWGFSSSPLVTGNVVIAAVSGQLVAYDLESGALRWSGLDGGGSYSSPHLMVIDGVPQILLMNGDGATSLDPDNGEALWQHPWSGFPMVQPAQTENGEVLISAGEGAGIRRLAVSQSSETWTVEDRWTSKGLKPYFNGFVVHNGHAFGFDGRILSCIELENGERRWKGGRYGSGQLVLLPDQDLLLVLSEKGELVLVEAKPDGFKELARIPGIDGKTWNHPVRVDDLLLVRNSEQMAAFRLPLLGK